MTEARGPFGPRHRWSLWIVGRWPVLIPRFPGGAAPREPPFVGVSAGSGPPTRGPYAAARQRPRGRSDGITCVRTGSEGLQWGQLDGRRRSPGAPGAVGAAGRRMSPLLDSPTYTPPLRGLVGPARSAPFARWSAGAGAHQVLGIWLILPVVICLSQRLSHACLSSSENKVKPRMAHYISYGSLDRTYYLDNCGNSRANTCAGLQPSWKERFY